ncbi:MAG: SH3 domain-containing protein [Caldilineaceae bacterium]
MAQSELQPNTPTETPTETKPEAKTGSPRWLVWLLVLILAIAIALLYRNFDSGITRSTTIVATTPQAGGMSVVTTTVEAAANATPTATSEPIKPPVLQAGQQVAAIATPGVRLYADAHLSAPIMDVYATGALFTVVEPSGDYKGYPVESDNRQWYRIRAADGLVGWADVAALATPTR